MLTEPMPATRNALRLAGLHVDDMGTLIDELIRRGLRYGLATLCVGGGMGIATIDDRTRCIKTIPLRTQRRNRHAGV